MFCFQGEVVIYGSHSELIERGVDTKQLLGLIKEGDEKQSKNEFSYEDVDVEEQIERKTDQQKCNPFTLKCAQYCSYYSLYYLLVTEYNYVMTLLGIHFARQ